MNYGRNLGNSVAIPLHYPPSERSLLAKSMVRLCWFAFNLFVLDGTALNKCEPADA